MLITGCDFHPGFQQVAIFDNLSGEYREQKLGHRQEAEEFYRSLVGHEVRVGMEACGHYPWFERLLEKLGHELWLGDAAEIRARAVRKQKTDRRDAGHILQLLREERFPRIWVPSLEEREVRQLLVHRHKQVQARTRTKNQLQAIALGQGMQKKRKLWTAAGRAEVKNRRFEWAVYLPNQWGDRSTNDGHTKPEEMDGGDPASRRTIQRARPWSGSQTRFRESEMAPVFAPGGNLCPPTA